MNNKSKKPYSTPSRTIKTKGVRKTSKNNSTKKVMKIAAESKTRKNITPSRTLKSEKLLKEKALPKKVNSDKKNTESQKKSQKPKKVNLEQTTRIRIDEDRINDFETLDTSFLEGRLDKKVKKNKKVKEKLLKEKKSIDFNFDFDIIKNIFFIILIIFGIILAVILFAKSVKNNNSNNVSNTKEKEVVVENKQNDEIDDNYLFVGDFYTKEFNFDDLDYHYVKVCEEDFTTRKVLDDLKEKVYKYNPSIVFIQLGIKDLDEEKEENEIIDNLEEIINKIKENRPYTKIYLESLYPINKDVDDYDKEIISEDIENEDIININNKLKDLAKSAKVNYLDLFELLNKDNKLDEKYTDNGVKLNDEAYKVILKEINKIVG